MPENPKSSNQLHKMLHNPHFTWVSSKLLVTRCLPSITLVVRGATLWGRKKQVRIYRLSDEVPWDVVVKNTVFQSDFALDSRRVKLIAALEWFVPLYRGRRVD